MNIILKSIIIFFVTYWIGGIGGVRTDKGIILKETLIPKWLNIILFLKSGNRVPLVFLGYQVMVLLVTILSLFCYYFKPFNNSLYIAFYILFIPGFVGGIAAFYLCIRDFTERRRNKRFQAYNKQIR